MTETKKIEFTPEVMANVQAIIKRYPEGKEKSALLPILHIAQAEFDNWLDVPVMDYVASILNIQPIEVYEVASFYTMYNLKPVGKYVLEFCHTGPCCLMGAEKMLDYIQAKLGIKIGETTPDGMFTLKTVECMAACGYAPMMQVGDFYYEHLTEEKVDRIFEYFRAAQDYRAVYKTDPSTVAGLMN